MGHSLEAMGNNGFDNFFGLGIPLGAGRGSNGKMDLVTFGLGIHWGGAWEAIGNNGFGNFWASHTTGPGLGKQWEPMDWMTLGLGIPLGQGLRNNGKQWIW